MATLVVCSGGLDSVTLAYRIATEGDLVGLVAFDYGQRHRKELDFASATAARLGAVFELVDLASLGRHLTGSALTDHIAVPEGRYRAETLAITVVPNRNAILLSIAFGLASSRGWERVATAMHTGDHPIYPDCRPAFLEAFAAMEDRALEGLGQVTLHAPFMHWSKTDIAAEANELGVPVAETWSCYRGEETHCGRCGTCIERREAFFLAGIEDPTVYADPDYWARAAHPNG